MSRLQFTREVPHLGSYNLLPRTNACLLTVSVPEIVDSKQTLAWGCMLHSGPSKAVTAQESRETKPRTNSTSCLSGHGRCAADSSQCFPGKHMNPGSGRGREVQLKQAFRKAYFLNTLILQLHGEVKILMLFFFCKNIYMKLLTMLMCAFSNGSLASVWLQKSEAGFRKHSITGLDTYLQNNVDALGSPKWF